MPEQNTIWNGLSGVLLFFDKAESTKNIAPYTFELSENIFEEIIIIR